MFSTAKWFSSAITLSILSISALFQTPFQLVYFSSVVQETDSILCSLPRSYLSKSFNIKLLGEQVFLDLNLKAEKRTLASYLFHLLIIYFITISAVTENTGSFSSISVGEEG